MTKSEIVLIGHLKAMKRMNGIQKVDIDSEGANCVDAKNNVGYIITDTDGNDFEFEISRKGQARFEFSAMIANLLMIKAGLPSDVVNQNICYTNMDAIRCMNMLVNWFDQVADLTEDEQDQFNGLSDEDCPDAFTGLSEV